MKRVPLLLGLRYSAGGSANSLVSFLSRLSMAGLVLGVALLLTVMSVMNGFDREMRERILALVPHVTLQPVFAEPLQDWQSSREQILGHREVAAVAPFLSGNALLIKGRHAEPILFHGIEPQQEAPVSRLGEFVELSLLAADKGAPAIILGAGLANKLQLQVGDSLSLAVPSGQDANIAAARRPVRFVRFTLAAVLNSGTELDQQLAIMSLGNAEKLLPGQPLSLRLRVADVFAAPRIAWELSTVHGRDYQLQDWSRQFGNMYHAIQMSRRLVVIMLLSVVAVAVFNIVSTLVLVVNDKRGDIAILRSQGASQADILLSFMVYGGVIGAIGTAAGAVLGVGLSLSIGKLVAGFEALFSVQILSSDVYPISYLPSDIRLADIVLLCSAALLMSFLATLYPAYRASRQPPAQALQHG